MGLMDKYNKGGVIFEIDITNFKFVSLEQLYKRDNGASTFWIDGLYINKKSSFGDHPVAIIAKENLLADLPAHLVEDVNDMLKTPEIVSAIKAGKIGFSVEEYTQKQYKKTCYGVKWREVE